MTGTLLAAHGFSAAMIVGLVSRGLATMAQEKMKAGGKLVEVARVRITHAGHVALAAGEAFGPPYTYGPPPSCGPPPGYSPSDEYSRPPGYDPPTAYGPPPGYDPPDDYGPPADYGPPPRPPQGIPYAVSPVRPACDLRWRCSPWNCGWRRVCYPAQPSAEHYARPYRGYAYRSYPPPPGPGYYGPY